MIKPIREGLFLLIVTMGKEFVPILKPWESAILKVVADDEVPRMEIFVR